MKEIFKHYFSTKDEKMELFLELLLIQKGLGYKIPF